MYERENLLSLLMGDFVGEKNVFEPVNFLNKVDIAKDESNLSEFVGGLSAVGKELAREIENEIDMLNHATPSVVSDSLVCRHTSNLCSEILSDFPLCRSVPICHKEFSGNEELTGYEKECTDTPMISGKEALVRLREMDFLRRKTEDVLEILTQVKGVDQKIRDISSLVVQLETPIRASLKCLPKSPPLSLPAIAHDFLHHHATSNGGMQYLGTFLLSLNSIVQLLQSNPKFVSTISAFRKLLAKFNKLTNLLIHLGILTLTNGFFSHLYLVDSLDSGAESDDNKFAHNGVTINPETNYGNIPENTAQIEENDNPENAGKNRENIKKYTQNAGKNRENVEKYTQNAGKNRENIKKYTQNAEKNPDNIKTYTQNRQKNTKNRQKSHENEDKSQAKLTFLQTAVQQCPSELIDTLYIFPYVAKDTTDMLKSLSNEGSTTKEEIKGGFQPETNIPPQKYQPLNVLRPIYALNKNIAIRLWSQASAKIPGAPPPPPHTLTYENVSEEDWEGIIKGHNVEVALDPTSILSARNALVFASQAFIDFLQNRSVILQIAYIFLCNEENSDDVKNLSSGKEFAQNNFAQINSAPNNSAQNICGGVEQIYAHAVADFLDVIRLPITQFITGLDLSPTQQLSVCIEILGGYETSCMHFANSPPFLPSSESISSFWDYVCENHWLKWPRQVFECLIESLGKALESVNSPSVGDLERETMQAIKGVEEIGEVLILDSLSPVIGVLWLTLLDAHLSAKLNSLWTPHLTHTVAGGSLNVKDLTRALRLSVKINILAEKIKLYVFTLITQWTEMISRFVDKSPNNNSQQINSQKIQNNSQKIQINSQNIPVNARNLPNNPQKIPYNSQIFTSPWNLQHCGRYFAFALQKDEKLKGLETEALKMTADILGCHLSCSEPIPIDAGRVATKTFGTIENFEKKVHLEAVACCLLPLHPLLKVYSRLGEWRSADAFENIVLGRAPTSTMTSVGEHLLSLIPHFDSASSVGDDVPSWMVPMRVRVIDTVFQHISQIEALSPGGREQLRSDLNYLEKVLTGLGAEEDELKKFEKLLFALQRSEKQLISGASLF